LKIKVSSSKPMCTCCPLNLPAPWRWKQSNEHKCNNCHILHASPPITVRLIFGSHVFIIVGALVLDGDSSLMLEVEATPYNCYMKPPFHVHLKVPSPSSNKSKILDTFIMYAPHSKHWTFMASITLSLRARSHNCQGCMANVGSLDVTCDRATPPSWMHLSQYEM